MTNVGASRCRCLTDCIFVRVMSAMTETSQKVPWYKCIGKRTRRHTEPESVDDGFVSHIRYSRLQEYVWYLDTCSPYASKCHCFSLDVINASIPRQIEFEDESRLNVRREDVYKEGEELPERVRQRMVRHPILLRPAPSCVNLPSRSVFFSVPFFSFIVLLWSVPFYTVQFCSTSYLSFLASFIISSRLLHWQPTCPIGEMLRITGLKEDDETTPAFKSSPNVFQFRIAYLSFTRLHKFSDFNLTMFEDLYLYLKMHTYSTSSLSSYLAFRVLARTELKTFTTPSAHHTIPYGTLMSKALAKRTHKSTQVLNLVQLAFRLDTHLRRLALTLVKLKFGRKFFTVWPPSASRHKLIASNLL